MTKPIDRLKHHVTGAIERGEKEAIQAVVSKSDHTPGPWKVETYCGPMFKIIREHDPDIEPKYRTKADAILIAAAPEMLEALEQALATLDKQAQTTEVTIVSEVIQQAITKTKGE